MQKANLQNLNQNINYLTICYEGAYLGKAKNQEADLFRYSDAIYKVNRDNGETTLIPEPFVECFLEND